MFNRIIFILCLLFSGLFASQTSGVFLGINAGGSLITSKYGGNLSEFSGAFPKDNFGYVASIDIGYKQNISNYGFKYYLEYSFSQVKGSKDSNLGNNGIQESNHTTTKITNDMLTFNIDYYYNIVEAFGLYAGFGVGYNRYKPNFSINSGSNNIRDSIKGGLAVPINLGMTININQANQIILGAKIPTINYTYKTKILDSSPKGNEGTIAFNNYIVQLGYNITF